MKKRNFILTIALLLGIGSSSLIYAQEQRQEAPSDTKVIIIEEKIDKHGNKTVTKTVREGQFTDEEIERMVEGHDGDHAEGLHERHMRDDFMLEEEHESKGYLGVQIENLEGGEGVEITEVVEGSAAEKAGLQEGDVVTSIGGSDVDNIDDLVRLVSSKKPGEQVAISYQREGEANSTEATLGSRSDIDSRFGDLQRIERMERKREMHKEHEDERVYNRIIEKTDKMKAYENAQKPRFGVYLDDAEDGGVRVSEVVDGSLAEGAGLKSGDVITEFNGATINSADELIKAVRSSEAGKQITVKYNRDGKPQSAVVSFK